MGYNFRSVEREQAFLLPPSLRDWLPEDDLAWLVLDAVAEMDLGPIYARYRSDGWGAAAFDPALMTALLLYAYATGERSSRRIEARCRRDIAYRVITANQVPDHATIARFRVDHEAALGDLFGEVFRLCAAAGLTQIGLLAIDGTKLAADAAEDANRTAAALDTEIAAILAEAAATDAAEDAQFGPTAGVTTCRPVSPPGRAASLASARPAGSWPRPTRSDSGPSRPSSPGRPRPRRPVGRRAAWSSPRRPIATAGTSATSPIRTAA